jgi:septal ring factor EnvC (AmiA/AmiB activator)
VANSHETSQDRLRREWIRSEKDLEALLARVEKGRERRQAMLEQTKAETRAFLRRLDRFDDSGSAPA